MKKLFVFLALCIAAGSFAQSSGPGYNTAFGAKFSGGIAASYKTFVAPTNAFEAQAMFFKEGIRLVGLYEFHFYTINGVPGLGWYLGPGAHAGFWKRNYRDRYNTTVDLGIDGVIGLDYKFDGIPVNISLDWQPSYSILGNAGLSPQFGGVAIRYVLD